MIRKIYLLGILGICFTGQAIASSEKPSWTGKSGSGTVTPNWLDGHVQFHSNDTSNSLELNVNEAAASVTGIYLDIDGVQYGGKPERGYSYVDIYGQQHQIPYYEISGTNADVYVVGKNPEGDYIWEVQPDNSTNYFYVSPDASTSVNDNNLTYSWSIAPSRTPQGYFLYPPDVPIPWTGQSGEGSIVEHGTATSFNSGTTDNTLTFSENQSNGEYEDSYAVTGTIDGQSIRGGTVSPGVYQGTDGGDVYLVGYNPTTGSPIWMIKPANSSNYFYISPSIDASITNKNFNAGTASYSWAITPTREPSGS